MRSSATGCSSAGGNATARAWPVHDSFLSSLMPTRELGCTWQAEALRPDPVMELQHVMGMSGEHARALSWCPGTNEAVFVSNSLVVAQVGVGKQHPLLWPPRG